MKLLNTVTEFRNHIKSNHLRAQEVMDFLDKLENEIPAEFESLARSIEARAKLIACDCGCERNKPEDAASVAYLRAANILRNASEGLPV